MGDWILWPTQDRSLPMRAVSQVDGSQEGKDGTFYNRPSSGGLSRAIWRLRMAAW